MNGHHDAARHNRAIQLSDVATLLGYDALALSDAQVRTRIVQAAGGRTPSPETWAAAVRFRAEHCRHLLTAAGCASPDAEGPHYRW